MTENIIRRTAWSLYTYSPNCYRWTCKETQKFKSPNHWNSFFI